MKSETKVVIAQTILAGYAIGILSAFVCSAALLYKLDKMTK